MKEIYTLNDLKHWQEVTSGEPVPLKVAVIGDPVAHSLSPQIHNPALEELGIEARYCRIELKEGEVSVAFKLMQAAGFIGTNVTIPHKQAALEAVDFPDDHARLMQAVNTVVFEKEKSMGFTTDGPGFVRAIREEFSMDLKDLRVMVVGAGGGAGRSIAVQCAMEGCERLVLANRTIGKAQALANELRSRFHTDKLEGPVDRLVVAGGKNIRAEMENVDLIVNATSLGMKRTDPSPVPDAGLSPFHMVYDTVYANGSTRLIEEAKKAGALAANGLSMLLHQAVLSFEIWFGRKAPVETMRKGMRSPGDPIVE